MTFPVYVEFDAFQDARNESNFDVLVDTLSTLIKNGGKVIVEHRFENAPSQTVAELDTVAKLVSWISTGE